MSRIIEIKYLNATECGPPQAVAQKTVSKHIIGNHQDTQSIKPELQST